MNAMSVSIEGNIGAGKSSLLPLLSEQDGVLPAGYVETHPEPLSKWQRVGDADGATNLLAAFYNDPHRWAYTFQVRLHPKHCHSSTPVCCC